MAKTYRVWAVVEVHDEADLIAHGKRVYEKGGGDPVCVKTVEDALIRSIVTDQDSSVPFEECGIEVVDYDAALLEG